MSGRKRILVQSTVGFGFLSLAFLPQAAVGADYRFPASGGDLPTGVYWRITGHKAPSKARDLSGVRFDNGAGRWTAWKPGAGRPKKNSDALIYGIPIYSMTGGEVVSCWRRAPENPRPRAQHPGRAGCSEGADDDADDGSDAPRMSAREGSSCTIQRSGNHLTVLAPDGRTILYAHLQTDSIPAELCPKTKRFVRDARDKSGPFGFVPEAYIEPGDRPKIKMGQFIGLVGNSGASSGPHLHLHINRKIGLRGRKGRVEMTFHGARVQQLVRGRGPAASAWERLNGPLPVTTPRTIIWPDKKLGFAAQ
jgi:murein DD-endopeptidase MepM/ murein hydrolase activator NlpD